jgi:hypothetical protein
MGGLPMPALQGFASGDLDQDAAAVRMFVQAGQCRHRECVGRVSVWGRRTRGLRAASPHTMRSYWRGLLCGVLLL